MLDLSTYFWRKSTSSILCVCTPESDSLGRLAWFTHFPGASRKHIALKIQVICQPELKQHVGNVRRTADAGSLQEQALKTHTKKGDHGKKKRTLSGFGKRLWSEK